MDTIKGIMEILRERLNTVEDVISVHSEETGNLVAGAFCESIPPEVAMAAGISIFLIPVKYQVSVMSDDGNMDATIQWIHDTYHLVILPNGLDDVREKLEKHGLRVYGFTVPAGWGEESSVALHNEMTGFFAKTGNPFDPLHANEELQDFCKMHDAIRKLVRGIAAIRAENPGLLSHRDLQVIFEAAACLPPGYLLEELSSVFSLLQQHQDARDVIFKCMVFGGMTLDSCILDEIESSGSVMIVEDDSCIGRRRFDISLDCQSPNLYYELLDMYSYKPYCPMLRRVEERYQLLYTLLKNHDINLVLFIEDRICQPRNEHSKYLYRKVRQDGIDAVRATPENAVSTVKDYQDRYNSGMRFSIDIPLDD